MLRHQVLSRAAKPVIEDLESRQLLSVSLAHGQLNITGSNHADKIIVQLSNDKTMLAVSDNGQLSLWTASKVHRVSIVAARGDDTIFVNEYSAPKIGVPFFIWGGRGNDTVTGGSGDDAIFGGRGDDDLAGADGSNSILGGAGTDTIEGVLEGSAAAQSALAGPAPAAGGSSGGVARPMVTTPPTFVVRDLGTLVNSAGDRVPTNLNQNGDVVGWNSVTAGTATVNHAFLRSNGSVSMVDLGTLGTATGGANSIAWDINLAGNIVGQSTTAANGPRQGFFRAAAGTTLVQLDASAGAAGNTFTAAYGINNSNVIVGESNGSPVRWAGPGGAAVAFLGTDVSGRAREINNAGTIVGQAVFSGGAHAFRNATDLGTLSGTSTSEAFDINDNAADTVIVGVADQFNAVNQKAWKFELGRMTELTRPNAATSIAYGVNDAGYIVGGVAWRTSSGGTVTTVSHAALWLPDASRPDSDYFIDLDTAVNSNTPERIFTQARAINNANQIVVEGRITTDTGTPLHAFLLTPGNPIGNRKNNVVSFSSTFTKRVTATSGQLVYSIFGSGAFTVAPTSVTLDLQTEAVRKNNFPSSGNADFTIPALTRRVVSTRKGTGEFWGTGYASVTLDDGTQGIFTLKFSGTTWRSSKKDFIAGDFVAVSSRGKIITQGTQRVYQGSFKPK